MERLRCRPIVHIKVKRPQRMNASAIWRGNRMKGREKEGRGYVGSRKGTDIGGIY